MFWTHSYPGCNSCFSSLNEIFGRIGGAPVQNNRCKPGPWWLVLAELPAPSLLETGTAFRLVRAFLPCGPSMSFSVMVLGDFDLCAPSKRVMAPTSSSGVSWDSSLATTHLQISSKYQCEYKLWTQQRTRLKLCFSIILLCSLSSRALKHSSVCKFDARKKDKQKGQKVLPMAGLRTGTQYSRICCRNSRICCRPVIRGESVYWGSFRLRSLIDA